MRKERIEHKRERTRQVRKLLARNYQRIVDRRDYYRNDVADIQVEISRVLGFNVTTNEIHRYVYGLHNRASLTGHKEMVKSISLHYYGLLRCEFEDMLKNGKISSDMCLCKYKELEYHDNLCYYCFQRGYMGRKKIYEGSEEERIKQAKLHYGRTKKSVARNTISNKKRLIKCSAIQNILSKENYTLKNVVKEINNAKKEIERLENG